MTVDKYDAFFEDPDKYGDVLTEGLSIDAQGNVKLTFSKKKSLMDDYMENHRMLDQAFKIGDYESVKYCLAVAFTLINSIERAQHNGSLKDKTADKARAGLINDFKSYSKKLAAIQPRFDFANYYAKLDLDKFVVDIPIETIQGIKLIVKRLLAA